MRYYNESSHKNYLWGKNIDELMNGKWNHLCCQQAKQSRFLMHFLKISGSFDSSMEMSDIKNGNLELI